MQSQNWVGTLLNAYRPRVGEVPPASVGPVPIGNTAQWVSNYKMDKFSRGWMDGNGGYDVEAALGSTAFDIRPTPYNGGVFQSHWRAAGPMAPVPGLSNMDVNTPSRAWNPLGQARAEWIPASVNDIRTTQDIVSGLHGPTVFTAAADYLKSPTPQMYWRAQVREGGEADPSVAAIPPPDQKSMARRSVASSRRQ